METINVYKKGLQIAECSYSVGENVHIESVYVINQFRNQGIGTSLIMQVIETAKELGKNVTITPTNRKNTRLYKRIGFVKKDKNLYVYEIK